VGIGETGCGGSTAQQRHAEHGGGGLEFAELGLALAGRVAGRQIKAIGPTIRNTAREVSAASSRSIYWTLFRNQKQLRTNQP